MRKYLMGMAVAVIVCGCSAPRADRIVDETVNAVVRVRQMTPPSSKYGEMTIEEAYDVQRLYAEAREEKLGPVVGHKVAFASKASQEACGLTAPVSGPLFASQKIKNGDAIEARIFMGFHIETELAVVMGASISNAISDPSVLKNYVASVHVAFDIPDNRFNAKPHAADIIATGAGAHRFVLGPPRDPSLHDIDKLQVTLRRNGDRVYGGPATAVLGSQWNSVLWVVNRIIERGGTVQPGHIILTGAVDKAYAARGADAAGVYVGDAGPLGKVVCFVE